MLHMCYIYVLYNTCMINSIVHSHAIFFRISKTADIALPFCTKAQKSSLPLSANYSSAAEFFCFIGVISFLMYVVLVPAYVFLGAYFAKSSLGAKVVSAVHASANCQVIYFRLPGRCASLFDYIKVIESQDRATMVRFCSVKH